MEVRTITCDVKGCKRWITEQSEGTGFPGWGHVQGLLNPETGSTIAHLCPEHLRVVAAILEGIIG